MVDMDDIVAHLSARVVAIPNFLELRGVWCPIAGAGGAGMIE
jgi:hypothetical protein